MYIYIYIYIWQFLVCFLTWKLILQGRGTQYKFTSGSEGSVRTGVSVEDTFQYFIYFPSKQWIFNHFSWKKVKGFPPLSPHRSSPLLWRLTAPHLKINRPSSEDPKLFHFKLRETHHFCSWSLLIFNIPTLGTFQLFFFFSLNLHILLYVSASPHYSSFLKFIWIHIS